MADQHYFEARWKWNNSW